MHHVPHRVLRRSQDKAFDAFCQVLEEAFTSVDNWVAAGRPFPFNIHGEFHFKIKDLYKQHTNEQLFDFVWSILFGKFLPSYKGAPKAEPPQGFFKTLLAGVLQGSVIEEKEEKGFGFLGGTFTHFLTHHLAEKWQLDGFQPQERSSSLCLDFLLMYTDGASRETDPGLRALSAAISGNFWAFCTWSLPKDKALCHRLLASGKIATLGQLHPVRLAMHLADVVPWLTVATKKPLFTPEEMIRFTAYTAALAAGSTTVFKREVGAPFWDRTDPFMPQNGVFFDFWFKSMQNALTNGLSAEKAVSWWVAFADDCRSKGERLDDKAWVDFADKLLVHVQQDRFLANGLQSARDPFVDLLFKARKSTWTMSVKAKGLDKATWSPELRAFVDTSAALLLENPDAQCAYKGFPVVGNQRRLLYLAFAIAGHVDTLMALAKHHWFGRSPEEGLGNSVIFALGFAPRDRAVPYLLDTLNAVRGVARKKAVHKALEQHAAAAGLPLDVFLEDQVPDLGLWPRDRAWVACAEGSVGFAWRACKVCVVWRGPSGKELAKPPSALKQAHPELAKEVRAKALVADRLCAAQRVRLQKMLSSPSWIVDSVWRERFIDHPTLGAFVLGTVWEVECSSGRVVCMVGETGPVSVQDGTCVEGATRARLWHPSVADASERCAVRACVEQSGWIPFVEQTERWSLETPVFHPVAGTKHQASISAFEGFVIRQSGVPEGLRDLGWKVRLCIGADGAETGSWVCDDSQLGVSITVDLRGLGSVYTPTSSAFFYAAVGPVRIEKPGDVVLDSVDMVRMLSQRLEEIHGAIQTACVGFFPWDSVRDYKKAETAFGVSTLPTVPSRVRFLGSAYGVLPVAAKDQVEIETVRNGLAVAMCLATGLCRVVQTGEVLWDSVLKVESTPHLVGGLPVESALVVSLIDRLSTGVPSRPHT
jgi:Domain of unknown function (DUF4132)